jgi:flagellar biogenesis protein FliO
VPAASVTAPIAAPAPAAPAPVDNKARAPLPSPVPSAAQAPAAQAKPVFANANKDDGKKGLKLANDQSSTMPMLIALSALLAVAYGALRLFLKKKAGTDEIPAINVVAQKRLGPRHQLVIVRAFDRDYLLSIQGGQTTVVARSSRRDTAAAEELLSPISRRPQNSSAPRANGRDFEDDEPTFGGELFKQALEQRERAREQTAGFRLETARAQARAELARRDDDRAAPSESLEVRSDAAVEPPPDPISDSVSGLLRLRRKAGR